MAEAIVSIALERLAAIIENKIAEEIGLVRGVKKEVFYLSSELTTIRCVLEDAEKRQYKEKSIQNWLKNLEDISYDVEEVLDEWNYAILKRQIERSENFFAPRQKKVCAFIPRSCLCFKKVATRRDIAVKIKGLKERLDMIVKEKDRYGFTVGQFVDSRESERVRSTSSIDVKEIKGREADKNVLVSKLILDGVGEESGPDVISIVGTGGIGKTTVAQLVYNDDGVINCFELRIWICVSDVFDEVRIAKAIVEIVKESSPNVDELEPLLECVRHSISGKKFLLVLDDVWTEDYTKWEPLKNSLRCGGPGSKILVTTRSERAARMMGKTEIHRLGQLSDTECWLLMQHIAFSGRRVEERNELYEIGKNIANKCKGLPLAVKVLGSLLRFKDTVEEWENVLNSEIWQLEEAEVDLFPHLLLSYNELSPAMKCCFSYCSIFPKDSEIDVEKLIRMWMAVGYLGAGGRPGDLELKGKEYFDNLRMRSFFQVVDGDERSCKMHDIVHDFAQFLMRRRRHNLEDHDGRVGAREEGSCQALDPPLASQIKLYRSLVCPRKLSSDLSDSVIRLRVLSSLKCELGQIPGYIENLIHLRYLDLSYNRLIVQVPQVICNLYNLQTLNLRWCELKEIPSEIGNLIHLRHLNLSWNGDIKELPETIGNLHNLRTLNLEFCEGLSGLPSEICKLYNLQTLKLCGCVLKEIPSEIGNLIHLKHLDLSWNGNIKELPETIGNLHNLRTLNLEFCVGLSGFPNEIHRLTNLRHLLNEGTDSLRQIPQGLEQLTALRTLSLFHAGRGRSKLGYLKKLNQLIGSLELQIILDDEEDVREAHKAELRNKEHIKCLKIWFFNRTSGLDEEELLKHEAMEALQPPPNLQLLTIQDYQGTKFPNWMTSSLNHLRVLKIQECNYCSTLPPLGKLPCLEELSVWRMNEFKVLKREFLGISGDIDGSMPSPAVVNSFPKLKKLSFQQCNSWKEWEDITAEEARNTALSIMPCLKLLMIRDCGLTALPHQLLRKASALENLMVLNSLHLSERYENKKGSGRRSLSHIPHVTVA